MARSLPTPNEILALAAEVLATHHPDADAAFVAGSFMRGQGSPTSDIDLVVLHPSLPNAYRESFVFKSIPVETFVHDPETLTWFLEHDRKDGHPALIGMLVEGVIIGPRQQTANDFKHHASQLLAAGPPPLGSDALERLRYGITDKLDDLAADRSPSERIAIGAALYPLLVELFLRGNNRWNASGKWSARLLQQADPPLARQFESAFLALYNGSDRHAVIQLADTLLSPHGGRLFANYRSNAPATWRASFNPHGS
jgi:predicted nucleotidyltransferase